MAMSLAARLASLGSPRRTRVAWRSLAIVAVVAVGAGVSWALKARDNAVIVAGQALARAGDADFQNANPALVFAQAHELAAADKMEPALARYRALYGHPRLSGAARYNSANLLMRQALVLRDGEAPGQALPLIELAKQGYREVLRADPELWDARYNFERAQRAQPDPDEADAPIGEPRAQAERSPTTTRGVGGGLP
jgi:mxaK protein